MSTWIVESPTDVQEHVTLLDRAIHVHPPVHPRHPEAERMCFGKRAHAVQGRDHRNAGELGEGAQLLRRTRLDDAIPGHDQRTLCLGEQRGGAADLPSVRKVRWPISRKPQLDVPVGRKTRLLRVLGDVDEHRSRPPTRGKVERLAEDVWQLGGVRHEVIVLRDRHGDSSDVDFLKCVLSQQGTRHLSGDRDERRGVHPGVGDGRHEIRCAGSTRGDTHAHATGRARIPLGGVAGTLLVPAEHVMQPVAVARERMVEGHDRAAGNPKDHIDALAHERLAHDLRAG
jgi:hypothetical protein